MARIRTIKPEFWKHEELSELPEPTHMLAAALLNYADDEGYFNANPKLIKAELFPLRDPSVSIQDSLIHLFNVGYLRLGTGADGKHYGQVVTFLEHQRVNRPIASKIKAVRIVWDDASTIHTQLTEDTPLEGKGKEEEGKGSSVPNGTAPNGAPDLKKLTFGPCLAWLAQQTGKSADQHRSIVGRWCRDYGEAAVIEAFGAAQRAGPIEPVGWIVRALKERAHQQSPPKSDWVAPGLG